jgi:hypothetical protein
MSGSSRSRKHKLEPISLEELAGTTGMSGFDTLLSHYLSPYPAAEASPQPIDLSASYGGDAAPGGAMHPGSDMHPGGNTHPGCDSLYLASAAVDSRAGNIAQSLASVLPLRDNSPHLNNADESIREAGQPPGSSLPPGGVSPDQGPSEKTSAKVLAMKDRSGPTNVPPPGSDSLPGAKFIGKGNLRRQIRRCSIAQDAHTPGQEIVYQALWTRGTPLSGKSPKDDTRSPRTITIGWHGIANVTRLHYKNCKTNMQSLIRKLAIEVIESYRVSESIGTTYRIYGYSDILARRHAAGMEWVVRGKGVEFVDPATGVEHHHGSDAPPGCDMPPSGGDLPAGGRMPTAPGGRMPTAPGSGTPTAPGSGMPPQSGREEESSSSEPRNNTSRSSISDDDEQTKYASTADYVKAIYRAKTGELPTVQFMQRLETTIWNRGKTFDDYVAVLRPHLGNFWKNPGGFMTHIAQIGFDTLVTMPLEKPKPKCQTCFSDNQRGAVLKGGEIVPCPACSTPEWVVELTAREAKRTRREGSSI